MPLTALTLALGVSAHLGLDNQYNAIHPHVRYRNEQFIAGAYYNSEDTLSMYGGYRIEPRQNVGIEIVMVTGYEQMGPIVPYVRGTYDIRDNTRLFIAPTIEKIDNKTNTGIVIGFEIKLKK